MHSCACSSSSIAQLYDCNLAKISPCNIDCLLLAATVCQAINLCIVDLFRLWIYRAYFICLSSNQQLRYVTCCNFVACCHHLWQLWPHELPVDFAENVISHCDCQADFIWLISAKAVAAAAAAAAPPPVAWVCHCGSLTLFVGSGVSVAASMACCAIERRNNWALRHAVQRLCGSWACYWYVSAPYEI